MIRWVILMRQHYFHGLLLKTSKGEEVPRFYRRPTTTSVFTYFFFLPFLSALSAIQDKAKSRKQGEFYLFRASGTRALQTNAPGLGRLIERFIDHV